MRTTNVYFIFILYLTSVLNELCTILRGTLCSANRIEDAGWDVGYIVNGIRKNRESGGGIHRRVIRYIT